MRRCDFYVSKVSHESMQLKYYTGHKQYLDDECAFFVLLVLIKGIDVLPTEFCAAAIAIDVRDSMEPRIQLTLFLCSQRDVDSVCFVLILWHYDGIKTTYKFLYK